MLTRHLRSFARRCRFSAGRAFSTLPGVDSSLLTITKNTSPKEHLPKEELVFGRTFTDHMLEIDWTVDKGWEAPKIVPYGDFQLSPAASVLHYAIECFEGMKAYKVDGGFRLFRPEMNMARMNHSCERLSLPAFDCEEFQALIAKLIETDYDWIPEGEGYSLYIRPTAISTDPTVGVSVPLASKLYAILSPVGPYYKEGFKPVKLLADPQFVRAWPGGTGDTKVGGNYALSLAPYRAALDQGYAQVLWLFGENLEITEVGTMNQFFFWVTPSGERELITAPLDGTILPGVTRDSILSLAREWGEFKVSERKYTMGEILSAVEEGRMIESFGSGTAAVVSPVSGISYLDKEYDIPCGESGNAGDLTMRFADTLMGIQYGRIEHPWSVFYPVGN